MRINISQAFIVIALATSASFASAQEVDRPPTAQARAATRVLKLKTVRPKGVADSDIPAFPQNLDRGALVSQLSSLPQACEGQPTTATADHVDRATGKGNALKLNALMNLVLTEDALSQESVQAIILSVGRQANGPAALRAVARLSRQIATRLYEAQLDTEGKSDAPAAAVIASIELDILLTVIESARIAHTAAANPVVAELAKSSIPDVAAEATSVLKSW